MPLLPFQVSGFKMLLVASSFYLALISPLIALCVVIYTVYKKRIAHEKVLLNNFPDLGVSGIKIAWLCNLPLVIGSIAYDTAGFAGAGLSFLIIIMGVISSLVGIISAFFGYLFLRWKNN